MQMTKNFTVEELTCRCGCGAAHMDGDFMKRLQLLREVYGRPMKVVSGYRCEAHNKQVGSTEKSLHRAGRAVDILVERGPARWRFVNLAMNHGFHGIGIAKNFIHIDDRSDIGPALWIYD